MRIITLPEPAGRVNAVARVLAAFVAHLHTEAERDSGNRRKRFDAKAVARLVMLAGVDLGTLTTADGDALLNELLDHARRLEGQRKGGAA